jgi:hypothetical protein
MKPSSPRAPLTPARARNCLLLNQCATPGLGSLMARRFFAGTGQLLLAVIGFGLFCAWFFVVLRQFYSLIDSDVEPQLHPWLALCGVGIFVVAWLWALGTSLNLLREAKRSELEGRSIPK